MKPLLMVLVAVLLVNCSPPCSSFTNGAPQRVCHRADAGAVVANQPFQLSAEMYTDTVSCEVIVDGGSLTLQLSGTACTLGGSSDPVVIPTQTTCTVPALREGQYVLNDPSGTTLTVGGPDAGVQPCAF